MLYKCKIKIGYILLMLSYLTVSSAPPLKSDMQKEKAEMLDMTKGLSDAELEMALSDLSLADLEKLSKLIDESNQEEYDYENEGLQKGNDRMQPFYGMKLNDDSFNADDQEMDNAPSNDLRHFKSSMAELRRGQRSDTPRSKREDVVPQKASPEHTEMNVNEDYIKQLENSFPRDQSQSDQEYSDQKKEHVRVKRQ